MSLTGTYGADQALRTLTGSGQKVDPTRTPTQPLVLTPFLVGTDFPLIQLTIFGLSGLFTQDSRGDGGGDGDGGVF